MSAPTLEVGVALGLANDGDFILDDATRGVLDGTDYTLASGYNDITGDSYSVSIRRGRFSQLWDAVEAGSASIEVYNMTRDFDPSYKGGPYAGFIVPGRGVQVTANGVNIWTGFVDDWDLSYDVSGMSSAAVKATDALGMLAQLQFDAWTSSSTTAGTKLTDVVFRSEVGWADRVDFDNGLETLQSDSVTWGSNVLNYCQLIARSEVGYFFADASGTLTYRDRSVTGSAAVASFGGSGIPFSGITAQVGSEVLFSRVGVDREGGTAQSATVTDLAAWRRAYGPLRSLSITGTLLATDGQSDDLAGYILSQYDTPRYRVSSITVKLHGLSGAQQNEVLAVDVTNTINVEFTPNGVGLPVVQQVLVQGIQHNISPSFHEVTFSLVDAAPPYFRLDSADYGVLDVNAIGF